MTGSNINEIGPSNPVKQKTEGSELSGGPLIKRGSQSTNDNFMGGTTVKRSDSVLNLSSEELGSHRESLFSRVISESALSNSISLLEKLSQVTSSKISISEDMSDGIADGNASSFMKKININDDMADGVADGKSSSFSKKLNLSEDMLDGVQDGSNDRASVQSIKKISSETSKSRLEKFENIKGNYDFSDNDAFMLESSVRQLRSSIASPQGISHSGVSSIIDDPALNFAKNKIAYLQTAMDTLNEHTSPADQIKIINKAINEIDKFIKSGEAESNDKEVLKVTVKKLKDSKSSIQFDRIQHKIIDLINEIEAKTNKKDDREIFKQLTNIEMLLSQLAALKANGYNNPALDTMKNSLEVTRTIISTKLQVSDRNKYALEDTIDKLFTELDTAEPESVKEKTSEFLKAKVSSKNSLFWEMNFANKSKETISERLMKNAPDLGKSAADEIAAKISEAMVEHFNKNVDSKMEILSINRNTQNGELPGIKKFKIGDETFEFTKKTPSGSTTGNVFEFSSNKGNKVSLKEFTEPDLASLELSSDFNAGKLKDLVMDHRGVCYSIMPKQQGSEGRSMESSLSAAMEMQLFPENDLEKVLQTTLKDIAVEVQELSSQGRSGSEINPSNFTLDKETGKYKLSEPQHPPVESSVKAAFLAPEMSGTGFNSKSDVWSLGITFHMMVYNQLPFGMNPDDSPEHVKHSLDREMRFNGTARPIESERPIDKLINKMLSFDPDKRISLEEVLQDEYFTKDSDPAEEKKTRSIMKILPEIGDLNKQVKDETARRMALPKHDTEYLEFASNVDYDKHIQNSFNERLPQIMGG
jgi:hypothetical protein